MKKVVVKIGSSFIAPKGKLDDRLISSLVKDILSIEKKGYKVVLVSSGAIACGLDKLGYKRKPQDIVSLMAISSLGQIVLMDVFNDRFKKYRRMCAQILLTWDDFDNRKRFMNVRKTLEKILAMNIIPIINENDAVSYEEIRLGDNDCISARVADLIGAQMLIILSDVEGLLDGESLVKEVSRIDSHILSLAKQEEKTHTAGGIITKLKAAGIAMSAGIKTVIANGRQKEVISRVVSGQAIGTTFLPYERTGKARKRWIIFSKKPKGTIFIDSGAQDAILHKGKSLLGVGILNCEGDFRCGDAVGVTDSQGSLLGYGIINYDSENIKQAKGKKLEREVIHRDNFVKFTGEEWQTL